MAIDRAPGLRGNANRLASVPRHENGFDLRGLCIFAADREEITDGSIHGREPARDARGSHARFPRESFAESGGHVRHRGNFKTPFGVERMMKLRAAKRPLAERCGELA